MTEFNGAKFDFQLDDKAKVLYCFAEGLVTLEIGNKYNDGFVLSAKKVAKKGYSLIVDVAGLKPISKEVGEKALATCLSNYLSNEYQFKKVFMIKIASPMMQFQVQKTYEQFPGFKERVTWVKDKQEAYSML